MKIEKTQLQSYRCGAKIKLPSYVCICMYNDITLCHDLIKPV